MFRNEIPLPGSSRCGMDIYVSADSQKCYIGWHANILGEAVGNLCSHRGIDQVLIMGYSCKPWVNQDNAAGIPQTRKVSTCLCHVRVLLE